MVTTKELDNFLLICEEADTKKVKDYYEKFPNLPLATNNNEALYWFCRNNNIELINWFLENQKIEGEIFNIILKIIIEFDKIEILNIFEKHNYMMDKIKILKLTCRYNNISLFNQIIESINIDENLIEKLCETTILYNKDNISILKKLIELNPNLRNLNLIFNKIQLYDKFKTFNYLFQLYNNKIDLDMVFTNICNYSSLSFVKLFFNILPNYNFENNYLAFVKSFHNDDDSILDYLLSKSDNIINIVNSNIVAIVQIEDLFDNDFISLNNIIKAYLLFPGLDVTKNSNVFFKRCCKENKIDWAHLLYTKYPNLYNLEIENNVIIKWNVIKNLKYNDEQSVSEINQCSVCLENLSDSITDCNHQFCYSCLNTIYNKDHSIFPCPLCRKNIREVNKIDN